MTWLRALCALLLASTVWAASFPKLQPERAFPELKLYDVNGSPWRAAKEDWVGARQRVKDDRQFAAWLRSEQQAVDAWMERHQDNVEWPGGWYHDFVSPKDGSHLIWTEDVPRRDVQFLRSPSDPKVEITPKIFAAWVFTFRSTHSGMMRRAAMLYRLLGDERYAAWAAAQLDFYAQHFAEFPKGRDDVRLYYQTLDVATNLVQYANTVRLLGDYAKPERKAQWYERFFTPQVDVLNRTLQTIHNIATWHRCAVMQVALVFDKPQLWEAGLNGRYGLRNQMAQGITSDYLWWEQSFGYNSYVVRAVQTLFTTAALYNRLDELRDEMNAAENLMLSPIYLRFPDSRAPNPADNAGAPLKVPDAGLLGSVYRVFPTSIGVREAAKTHNWETLLDPAPAPTGSTELPPVVSRNLESSRMALLRAEGWQVYFHYGQLTRSHAQAEALNFAAFYEGTDITHDPGTVGYGSPLHREYYTQGLNHNVPLIDGEGQEPPQAGELISFSATPARVEARQPKYRSNASASRRLEITNGALEDTTTVEVAGNARRLGLTLQLQGQPQLPPDFVPDGSFAAGRPAGFKYWRDVKRASYTDRAELLVRYGERTVRVQIEAPGAFTIWQGSTPDIPPRRRAGLFIELNDPATKAVFRTRLSPVR